MEVTLRLFNFQYANTPQYIQNNIPIHVMDSENLNQGDSRIFNSITHFQKDPNQLWVPIHSFGKRYPDINKNQKIRIITLGDSCSAICFGTSSSYPDHMQKILNESEPQTYEIFNAAVGAHTSFQGIKRLSHTVLPYKPDVVTIQYGWNDHWLSAVEDKYLKTPSQYIVALQNNLEKFKTYQFMNFSLSKIKSIKKQQFNFRVSLNDYKANLEQMIQISREHGIQVALITAPARYEKHQPMGIFPYSKEKLSATHKKYNDVVRKVADEHQVVLIDLAQWASKASADSVLSLDGIHFTAEGCQKVAAIVLEKLSQQISLIRRRNGIH